MSSPHLGSRRPDAGGLLKKSWRFLVHGVVRTFYSQTGKELLYEEPNLELKEQLLYQLSDPSKSNHKICSVILMQHDTCHFNMRVQVP